MKKRMIIFGLLVLFSLSFSFVSAQSNTVCCERTNTGAYCQDVPADECLPGSQQVPTSCDSTSFCRAGTCYDSGEGICMDNTPQLVCNDNGGIWSENPPAQCNLGCCILGDQAAYVSLVRCKKLSAFLGLETNYDTSISTEVACVAAVQAQDKGACVFEFEFERTCTFMTRGECEGNVQTENGTISDGEFFADKLCTAEELGTTCGRTTETTCIPGKDEVYFVDTCGNAANIYDSSKINDQEYWTNVKLKSESCNANSGNAESVSCGNCDYLLGSFCRDKDIAGKSATYGDNICADLNCKNTANGESYLHGESWCVYDDFGDFGEGDNSVGSRFYKHICINGEEVLEACDDFRAHECIEDDINGFAQAACRVNRWQDCLVQVEEEDCENEDRRDCFWRPGDTFGNFPEDEKPLNPPTGICLPKNSPGLNFWDNEETLVVCSQGHAQIVQKCEEGLFGGEDCKPSDSEISQWYESRKFICSAVGDCGPGDNWVGVAGFDDGFEISSQSV